MAKRKTPKNRYQKPLNPRPDKITGLTEHDENFVHNPGAGPYSSDEEFDFYHRFEFFSPKTLAKAQKEFKKLLKQRRMFDKDIIKIETAVKSFTVSSTRPTRVKAVLYKSLLKDNPGILTQKYESYAYDGLSQTIKPEYFETFERFDKYVLRPSELITPGAIEKYQECAAEVTLKYLKLWVEYMRKKDPGHEWADELSRIPIYRGINNRTYYKKMEKQRDFISVYKSLTDDFPFFENQLLSSYTLSPNLAEQFMIGNPAKQGQRRVLISCDPDCVKDRMLSSFIVSPNFMPGQYELICMPDTKYLQIKSAHDDIVHAGFTIFDPVRH